MKVKDGEFVNEDEALQLLALPVSDLSRLVGHKAIQKITVYSRSDVERHRKNRTSVIEAMLPKVEELADSMDTFKSLAVGLPDKQRTDFLKRLLLGSNAVPTRTRNSKTQGTDVKRKRVVRTAEEQKSILEEVAAGTKMAEVARKHNISASTILNWRKKQGAA